MKTETAQKEEEEKEEEEADDDGTGVEFTHPAGSENYRHICFMVMSHPCYWWKWEKMRVSE